MAVAFVLAKRAEGAACASSLRRQSEERGLVHPQHMGRIYRVVPADRPVPRAAPLPTLTTPQCVERLSHPNGWWRSTAQRLLVERGDASVIPAVHSVAKSGSSSLGRMHALWTLAGMDAIDRPTVLAALRDPDPAVRLAALRISERFLKSGLSDEIVARVLALTRDERSEVQLQAMLSAGEIGDPAADYTVAQAICLHPRNVFLRDAFFSGLHGRENALFTRLIESPEWPDDREANKLLSGLARGILASGMLADVERLFSVVARLRTKAPDRASAIIDGLVAATPALRRPLRFPKEPAGWLELERVYEKQLAKLNPRVVWPDKPGATPEAPVQSLNAQQQARFEAGMKIFALCAACHQPTGRGLDGIAPPLLDSEWVLGSPERLVRVLLHGLRGEISVLGRKTSGDMPGVGSVLDDEQIASVLTYIRREWGHTAALIEPNQVKRIRAETAGRSDGWSGGELRRFAGEPAQADAP